MSITPQAVEGPGFRLIRGTRGPLTAARQTRAVIVLALVYALGLGLFWAIEAAGWRAFGLGLLMPGGGFVATGGWLSLLFPLTFALFLLGVFIWFATGMVLLPPAIWLGAAALAGFVARDGVIWDRAVWVVLAFSAAVAAYFWNRSRSRRELSLAKFERRAAFLPQAMATLDDKLDPVPAFGSREIGEDDIGRLRYALDRALQPVDGFNGFDKIDQFQPASYRYQINHIGYGLGAIQAHYLPNFHGYMTRAQKNLIEKYRDPRVWRYWRLESMWGHLNFTNFDPAARDNIMLTGWYAMHVAQYMHVTGDRSYLEPGSLSFRLNDRTVYKHDLHSIVRSVVMNMDAQAFCLYPCEPNWIYPICNHYAMTGLAAYDSLVGSDHVRRYADEWYRQLETEFMDESGSYVGLRSSLLGVRFPFPASEAAFTDFANAFSPDRASQLWALARTEIGSTIRPGRSGKPRINLPKLGIDFGNYRRNNSLAYAVIACSAGEMGDMEILEATRVAMEEDGQREDRNGVTRYLGASNMANVRYMRGLLARRDDLRASISGQLPASVFKGPVLADAPYPDAMVAKAVSHDGTDLELVLYPGAGRAAAVDLDFARLEPGRRYGEAGGQPLLQADSEGRARLSVSLAGRTRLHLRPLA
jgi:hypothetical protein